MKMKNKRKEKKLKQNMFKKPEGQAMTLIATSYMSIVGCVYDD